MIAFLFILITGFIWAAVRVCLATRRFKKQSLAKNGAFSKRLLELELQHSRNAKRLQVCDGLHESMNRARREMDRMLLEAMHLGGTG